jgi:hypothetical protein
LYEQATKASLVQLSRISNAARQKPRTDVNVANCNIWSHVRGIGRVEELFKSKLLQLLTCSFMINMAKAMYTESFGHLYKHGPVFNIHYLPRTNLCSIQCDAENIGIGFSKMNKTGNNKKIRKSI